MKPSANDETMPSDVFTSRPAQARPEEIATALDGVVGAEISGIDLRQPISESLREQILTAFAAHHLLVFRGQKLGKDRMGEVAAMFGEVEGNVFRNPDGSTLEAIHQISNLDATGRPAENPYLKSNYFWHSDKAYLPVPALLTMLHAVELPPSGGDTQFADMIRAHASLSDEVRQQVSGLRAVHSLEYMRVSTGDRAPTDAERRAAPPVVHPLVRTHPETGEKSLFVGMYCSRIVGMDVPRAARFSISCSRMRRNRGLSIRIAGVRVTWSSGTIAACCTARWPTTTWPRAGACCCAWWSRVVLLPDPSRREPHLVSHAAADAPSFIPNVLPIRNRPARRLK